MAARIVNITNISPQVVRLLYGTTPAANNTSQYAYTDAGEIAVSPGASTEVEESRLDQGQLETMRRKGLIATTVR